MAGIEDYEAQGSLNFPDDEDFNKDEDCEVLEKAMKGFGTDEQAIIDILGQRSEAQRLEITTQYKTMFGKDLHHELKSETGGHFEDLVIMLTTAQEERDAKQLHDAMSGAGTTESVLCQIIATRPNDELQLVKDKYKELYDEDLEERVVSETSGYFQRCLVSLLQCNRSEDEEIDEDQLEQDVNDLYEAGEGCWGTDESRFNVIMCSRSFPYLRELFIRYEEKTGSDIIEVIESEMSGDVDDAMVTIARCVKYKPKYYAKVLYKSMKGFGTSDDILCRTIINRCEIDMEQIKECFLEISGDESLASFIADDCSGDYKKLLLTLIGEAD